LNNKRTKTILQKQQFSGKNASNNDGSAAQNKNEGDIGDRNREQ